MRVIQPSAEQVRMPRSEQWRLVSRNGRAYRIFLAWPEQRPSDAPWAIHYVLDANAWFGTFVESLRMQARRPDATGVHPAVVVGIGYPTDGSLDIARRTFDLTPPGPAAPAADENGSHGGADHLLDFIAEVVHPAVERRFGLSTARRTIFGHSLGGLFALYALFTRPGCFQAHAAASPSIWYGDRLILAYEAAFRARASDLPGHLGLHISAGSLETPAEAPGAPASPNGEPDRAMVSNAEAMAERLQALGSPGLAVQYHLFEGENHVSVVPGAISRALRFFGTASGAMA